MIVHIGDTDTEQYSVIKLPEDYTRTHYDAILGRLIRCPKENLLVTRPDDEGDEISVVTKLPTRSRKQKERIMYKATKILWEQDLIKPKTEYPCTLNGKIPVQMWFVPID